MNLRIIYPNDTGGISVIVPSDNCGLSIEEIARKDVPEGIPYKIISVSDLPPDRDFRGAWEADFTEYDGIGIGHEAWFSEQEVSS